jgi:hypothetical protein
VCERERKENREGVRERGVNVGERGRCRRAREEIVAWGRESA